MKKILFTLLLSSFFLSCSKDDPIEPANPTPTPTPTPTPVLEPGEVSLVLPENNKECENGVVKDDKAEIEFQWKAVDNADKYEIVITGVEDGKMINFGDLKTTSKKVELLRGQAYTWNIIASNSSNKTSTSPIWKFFLAGDGEENHAPSPAIAIYPKPGATINLNESGIVKLEWASTDPDDNQLLYTLRIDTLDGKQDPPSSLTNLEKSTIEIELESGKIYYWSVETKDPSISIQSEVFSFKTN